MATESMATPGGDVEWLPAILGRRAGLRPSAQKVLRNSDMAELGGDVEGLPTIVLRRADLRPSSRKVLRKSDVTVPRRPVEGEAMLLQAPLRHTGVSTGFRQRGQGVAPMKHGVQGKSGSRRKGKVGG